MIVTFELLDRHIKAIEHAIKGQTGVTVESYVNQHLTRWLSELVEARKEDRNAELIALLLAAPTDVQRSIRQQLGQTAD